jgi:hypothetical protein
MARVCRLLLVLALIACSKKDPPPAAQQPAPVATTPSVQPELPRPQHVPGTRPARPANLELAVTVAGKPTTWPASVLETATKLDETHAEAPQVWSLRDVVKAQLGPKARVTAVISADGKQAIDEATWKDATTLPILHTTRRGSLNFRWQDAHGVWGDVVTKDVTGLEVQN